MEMLAKLKQKLQSKGELYLSVKVLPQSGKSALVKYQDEILYINLKAVPQKGKANAELVKLLAKEFGQNQAQVKIISGAAERKKLLKISL